MFSPPFPTGLLEDISERADREVLFGMRNCDLARLFWVFKLVVISFGMMENPPVLFQSFYNFPTLHNVYYTHPP
jgi:hypothetical protein